MKKVSAFLLALLIMFNSLAAFTPAAPPALRASSVMMPIGKMGKSISLLELSTMKVKDYQNLSGQQMKFSEKIAFKLTQKEIKKVIKNDGTVDLKKMEALNKKMQMAADNKSNLRWALILAGAAIVLSLLGAAVPFLWILASIAWIGAVVFFIIWLVNMAR